MYSGTMIEDLIRTVQAAESATRPTAKAVQMVPVKPVPMADMLFFYQMQTMNHVQVGLA